jgi:hypothetical protein
VSECVSEWNVGEKSDNKRGSAITVVLPSELCIHRRCMQAIPSNHIPIFLIPWVTLERSNGSLLQCHTKDGNRVSCWWIVICDSDSIQLNNNSILLDLFCVRGVRVCVCVCARVCMCVCVCVCVCACAAVCCGPSCTKLLQIQSTPYLTCMPRRFSVNSSAFSHTSLRLTHLVNAN